MRPPPPHLLFISVFRFSPPLIFRKVLMKLNIKNMNIFQRFIKRIGGEDKVLHFETCCLITMAVAFFECERARYGYYSFGSISLYDCGYCRHIEGGIRL